MLNDRYLMGGNSWLHDRKGINTRSHTSEESNRLIGCGMFTTEIYRPPTEDIHET